MNFFFRDCVIFCSIHLRALFHIGMLCRLQCTDSKCQSLCELRSFYFNFVHALYVAGQDAYAVYTRPDVKDIHMLYYMYVLVLYRQAGRSITLAVSCLDWTVRRQLFYIYYTTKRCAAFEHCTEKRSLHAEHFLSL